MKNRIARAALSLTLAAAMTVGSVIPAYAGASTDPNASAEREATNAQISQSAATEGMVLLDNESGVLPMAKSGNVALFGAGVYATVKGGTGSGDVYLKDGANIDVEQGFEDAGYNIVNKDFIAAQEAIYNENNTGSSAWGSYAHDEPAYEASAVDAAAAKTDTAVYVLARNSGEGNDRQAAKGDYYLSDNEKANLTMLGQKFDKVIVVLNTGGILDTNFYNGKGGYAADDELNRGKIEGLDALLLMSQAGQNGGHAVVEVLNGTVNPSGKLTDTWAVDFTDYPSSATFSHLDDETLEEIYTDDIYVGYRYFDTFGKDVAYEFGYGDSYTDFDIDVKSVTADEEKVTVIADVTNTGSRDGKEVVEVYFSAPEGNLDKPYQELAGYKKVSVKAGATKTAVITFDTADMSSYDESKDAYVMEDGTYTIRVGNSSRNTVEAAQLTLNKDVITEKCRNNLGLTKDGMQSGNYEEGAVQNNDYVDGTNSWGQPTKVPSPKYGTDPIEGMLDESSAGYGTGITPTTEGLSANAKAITLAAASFPEAEKHTYSDGVITTYVSADAAKDSAEYAKGKTSTASEKLQTVEAADGATLVDVVEGKVTMEQLVADMSNEELADLVEGGTWDGLSGGAGEQTAVIGSQADSVYGAAGETTSNLYTSRFIPNVVMSDGPAGIRITNSYIKYSLVGANDPYDAAKTYYTATYSWSGARYTPIELANEAAYKAELAKGTSLYTTDNVTYYQYCTAMPIGTLLAQTWDPAVIEKVGRAVATEMLEYGVTSWLAPGMNIHRSPLCGRNFEYYSEDPLVCGLTAAAETKGVETKADGSESGVGVTLKHVAFNNQENSRMGSNSVVSERAAREIYLKGFEIGVKNAQPDYIMSSYNMVNGYSTFENYGLLTEILRNEWGFEGFVMTDWYSVGAVYGKYKDRNVQGMLMYAGNDCEMPGSNEQSLLSALETGNEMRLGDLQRSAINMLNVIKRSEVFSIMKGKLDAAKDTTISDLNKQLNEAKDKLKELQSKPTVSPEELKKAQDELAAAKAQLAVAKKGKIVTDKAKYTVKKGKTVKITAVASNGKKVTFKSKNKKIATVSKKGNIKGVKKGTTKIVIKAGAAQKTVKVTVK